MQKQNSARSRDIYRAKRARESCSLNEGSTQNVKVAVQERTASYVITRTSLTNLVFFLGNPFISCRYKARPHVQISSDIPIEIPSR